jgi:hypothetical protein
MRGASRVVKATVPMLNYCTLAIRLEIMRRTANATKAWRFRTPTKLYLCEAILQRLAQDLQGMAAALGPFIQEEHAVMGQRHLAGHRHVTTADQPCTRDGVMAGATRAGGDQRRAVAGEPGDAVDAGAVEGIGEGFDPAECP